MSDILCKTEEIRAQLKRYGRYRELSCPGLSYHWIQKFACGVIKNPTVENLARLETALKRQEAA